MAKLEGRVILVAGGAGNVGEGIVKALLLSGAQVIVPSRAQERLDALRQFVGAPWEEQLLPLVGNIGDITGAEAIRDEIVRRTGRLDAVVASLGGWWQGIPLVRVSLDTWHKVIDNNLTSHFIAARTFLPLLLGKAGSSYTLLAGFSGEDPYPNAGPVSIAVAGQLMLRRVLSVEAQTDPVRINDLILGPVMTRVRGGRGNADWVTGEDVGAFVARLASDAGAGIRDETIYLMDQSTLAEASQKFV